MEYSTLKSKYITTMRCNFIADGHAGSLNKNILGFAATRERVFWVQHAYVFHVVETDSNQR